MGLVIERKRGQAIHILFDENMSDQDMLDLIRSGITVRVTDIGKHGTKTRIGIDAPEAITVLREELLERHRSCG
ncbi:carbon storage regulator [Ectopseudomonas mendocina]|nr:carbon storage regulator [Pseudomonas mendocina]